MAARPIVYDATYVVSRLGAPTPTGIERVDAAFARHFLAGPGPVRGREATALHYGLLRPHTLRAGSAARLVAEADLAWRSDEPAEDRVFAAVADWLATPPAPVPLRVSGRPSGSRALVSTGLGRAGWRLRNDRAGVGRDAIYLNVAQYAFEYHWFFRWMLRRPDVRPVFFVHDLLPLDHPEFFRAGYGALFERRVRTIARFAQAVLVSSEAVAGRLEEELARRGRRKLPVFASALPPPTRASSSSGEDMFARRLDRAAPYFVAVGTIEPRKNHLLLLNLWRDLARTGPEVPRLVLVGARGWDNEQVLDHLERSRVLAPHVAEVSGLSTAGLRRLIAGARAVLVPSFAEGYGLPIAEALAEGTPVVASDLPVFREVSQGTALLLDPTDGPGWRDAVRDLASPGSKRRRGLAARAGAYVAPAWPAYFEKIERFLADL